MVVKKESDARLSVATKAIEKEYGHVVKWLNEAASVKPETISTGCVGLDNAIGNGGFERGLIVELFGRSGAGKSFLGYSTMLQAAAKGHKCAIVDAENSLDPKLLVKIGMPLDKILVVSGAATGEANLSIADNLMQTGEFAVVMIDSVAALIPEARVESDYAQQTMGLHARLMSAGIQKILPVARKTDTLLIFINQIRNKIGSYGNPETTTGGEALPFYASYRVEVIGSPQSKGRRLVDDSTGEVYGHKTTFRVVKNRRAAPFREAEVDLIYGLGYDSIGEMLEVGADTGVIERSGAWYQFEEHKWQGKEKARLFLDANKEVLSDIERKVKGVISGESFDKPAPEEKVNTDDKSTSKKRKTIAEGSVS
jgi:recombination protein RecA